MKQSITSALNQHQTLKTIAKPICSLLLGFLLGFSFSFHARPSIFSMILQGMQTPMSIDGLLTAYFFPFLLITGIVVCGKCIYLPLYIFFRAFSFSYLSFIILFSINASWLLIPLLLLPDLFFLIALFVVHIFLNNFRTKYVLAIFFFCTVLIALLDYNEFSVFLSSVINEWKG